MILLNCNIGTQVCAYTYAISAILIPSSYLSKNALDKSQYTIPYIITSLHNILYGCIVGLNYVVKNNVANHKQNSCIVNHLWINHLNVIMG